MPYFLTVRGVERVEVSRILHRIEEIERRLDVLEEVIEALIPEDDEEFHVDNAVEVREYRLGDFTRWGKVRGLIR